MAQDFYAAFGVGEDQKFITTIDADGVALAAIQGLYEIVMEKEAELARQAERIEEQGKQIAELTAKLNRIESMHGQDGELQARLTALEKALGATAETTSRASFGLADRMALPATALIVLLAIITHRRVRSGGAR